MTVTKRRLVASVALVAGLAVSASAIAQDEEGKKDEIVVTATKRAQTLQEVPVAVSVTSEATIEKAGINDLKDLQSVVPSLRVHTLQNSIQTTFSIRGFGNGANNPGIEPSVGVFIDGVYRARSAGAISDLPTLDRVEVLRGPQSTLFGKNASAGVISVVTKKPSFERGGYVSGTYGNYNTIMGKAYFTGPLGDSDKAAFSIGGGFHKRDGYYKNLAGGDDQNDRNRWNVRGQLLLEPGDNASFRLIADYDQIDEICCGVANLYNGPTGAAVMAVGGQLVPNAPFAREGYYDINPYNKVKNGGLSMQADINFDKFDVTSITSYRIQRIDFDGDVDFTSAALIGMNRQQTDTDSFSQELRIASNGDGPIDWLLGGFYYSESLTNQTDLTYGPAFRAYADVLTGGSTLGGIEAALGLPSGTFFAEGQGLEADFTQQDDTFSLFGQVDWHLNDRLTATGGLNWTKDRKNVTSTGSSTDVFSSLQLNGQDGANILVASTIAAQFPNVAYACGLGQIPYSQANVMALYGVASCPGLGGISGAMAFQGLQQQVVAGVGALNLNDPTQNPLLGLQPLQFLPPYLGFPNAVEGGRSSDSEITWTARLAYDVNDMFNVYASIATGYKPTTWNLSRDSRPADLAAIQAAGIALPNLTQGSRYAGPEKSTVYELGVKTKFDRGFVNFDVFKQSIDGFQSNIFTGTGFLLANAGEQSVNGFEVDSAWNPVDPLNLTFGLTYLDPKYDSFVNGTGVNGPEDLSGTRPAGIPSWSITTSATYSFDLGHDMSGFIRGAYDYQSDVQIIENTPANVASREVSMVNASFGLNFANGVSAMLWARNLFNDDYLQSAFPSVAQSGSYSGYPNAPRMYGITLRKDW